MNNLVMTKSILNEIFDDKTFKDEVSELINSLIDAELQKEEADFDFIDECADVLIEVQTGNYSSAIPFVIKNKFENEEKKRRVLSIFFACAIAFSLSFGAIAVNYTVERKKEEQKTTQTTTAATEKKTTSSTASKTELTTAEKKNPNAKAVNLNLKFSSAFKSNYKAGEKLSLNGITVTVSYNDETEKNVDINDCKIIKSDAFGKNSFVEKVTVEFEGVRDSFFVTFGDNVTELTVTHYTGFEKSTEAPKIQASSKYFEVKAGERISIPMSKSNDGFVCFTTDNDNLEDISISYQGGKNGRQIYLNATAGQTAGVTTVSLAYERNPNVVLAKVTVKVIEDEPENSTDGQD